MRRTPKPATVHIPAANAPADPLAAVREMEARAAAEQAQRAEAQARQLAAARAALDALRKQIRGTPTGVLIFVPCAVARHGWQ
jgi:hypothetical protein